MSKTPKAAKAAKPPVYTQHLGLPLVGPFPASVKPVADRRGLYLRVSEETGNLVFADWNGSSFGRFSDSPERAKVLANGKRSKRGLPWYGFAKPEDKAPAKSKR